MQQPHKHLAPEMASWEGCHAVPFPHDAGFRHFYQTASRAALSSQHPAIKHFRTFCIVWLLSSCIYRSKKKKKMDLLFHRCVHLSMNLFDEII